MASFPSRYAGTCSKCGKGFAVGTLISWNRRRKGQAYHMPTCSAPEVSQTERPVYAAAESVTATVAIAPQQLNGNGNGNGHSLNPLAGLADLLTPLMSDKIKASTDGLEALVEEKFRAMKAELAGVTTLEIKRDDAPTVTLKGVHKQLKDLLFFVTRRIHVYLHGKPGTGKSTAARHCADALGLPWGYIALNPQTPESRLLGFIDAGGTYRPTVFRNCYENGGIFCIDEMDNASAALLTTLNSMLENGHAAFPDGMIERHKDFVLVATGNTNGRGGNPLFPERRAFDSAFTERFVFVEWDVDADVERTVTLAINPDAGNWLAWVQKLRAYVDANRLKHLIVSPRASFRGAETILGGFPLEYVAEATVFKGLDRDTVARVLAAVPLPKRGA